MERRWKILSADENKIAELQQALKISYSLCKILVQRGIDTYDKAKDFFRPQLSRARANTALEILSGGRHFPA